MRSLGDDYEIRASQWLQDQGVSLLARNFAGKTGEIDIIAQHNNHLVFLEVRARSNLRFASAAASVDKRKQQRIMLTAQLFLQRHPKFATMPCRFDVITFEPRSPASDSGIRWIRGAFTA